MSVNRTGALNSIRRMRADLDNLRSQGNADACPKCGGETRDPSREEYLTIADMDLEEVRLLSLAMCRPVLGNPCPEDRKGKLAWCPTCNRLVATGRFDVAWHFHVVMCQESYPALPDPLPPGLDRWARDCWYADQAHRLRMEEEGAARGAGEGAVEDGPEVTLDNRHCDGCGPGPDADDIRDSGDRSGGPFDHLPPLFT